MNDARMSVMTVSTGDSGRVLSAPSPTVLAPASARRSIGCSRIAGHVRPLAVRSARWGRAPDAGGVGRGAASRPESLATVPPGASLT